jgi:arsenate reductase
MRVKVYGIRNCDTVKRARAWLYSKGVDVEFHDFKTAGISRDRISSWLKQTDLESLLNRRGLTWRKLTDARKAAIKDDTSAIDLMLEQPSIIKRPVLECGEKLLVGFDAGSYAKLLEAR